MSFIKGQTRPAGAGRKKGTPNKVTVERAIGVESLERQAGRRLAVERMAEAMEYWFGIAGRNQPNLKGTKDKDGKDINPDAKLFVQAMKEGARLAEALAPYQTPKLQSTTLRTDAPPAPIELRVRFV